jgi:Ca2+-binding EF-hand superfamily protein
LADTSKDTKISLDEFKAFIKIQQKLANEKGVALGDTVKVSFDTTDIAPKDSKISIEEWKSKAKILKADANPQQIESYFNDSDSNKDGFLDLDEFRVA